MLRYFRSILFLALLLPAFAAQAQSKLTVMVPEEDLVIGQSYRIQYLWRSGQEHDQFEEPVFSQFRRVREAEYSNLPVSGAANEWQHVVSLVLEPLQAGSLQLPQAKLLVGNQHIISPHTKVKVISRSEADRKLKALWNSRNGNPNLVLLPGEDPMRKIRDGLFVKLELDRKTAYVGQPITASYRLYSCLRSQSDIVKNPAFYGFAVQEMIGLKENIKETRQLNGRSYDVHTIRKVQLYPISPGQYTIDAMEISSRVQFSKKPVSATAQQQIVEGVLPESDNNPDDGWEVFDYSMHTEPVSVRITELPAAGKPADWSGAVGRFDIQVELVSNAPAAKETAMLDINLTGKGNFLQLVSPKIEWPAGLESFDAEVMDQLDSSSVPVKGQRKFRIRFVADKDGQYRIPAISFVFFDPEARKYIRIASDSLSFTVLPERPKVEIVYHPAEETKPSFNPSTYYLIAIVLVVIAAVFITWRRETKKDKLPPPPPPEPARIGLDEFLATAKQQIDSPAQFYSSLYQGVLNFLTDRLVSGKPGQNKNSLLKKLDNKVPAEELNELARILETCEIRLYSAASGNEDPKALYEKTFSILSVLDQ